VYAMLIIIFTSVCQCVLTTRCSIVFQAHADAELARLFPVHAEQTNFALLATSTDGTCVTAATSPLRNFTLALNNSLAVDFVGQVCCV
jgi:hypothetical protein